MEGSGRPGGPDAPRPTLTLADLQRWQESGATWRALEVTDEQAVVELCTCTGEPVDLLTGTGRELVAFVRECGLSSG
jgi:hypothetical protein